METIKQRIEQIITDHQSDMFVSSWLLVAVDLWRTGCLELVLELVIIEIAIKLGFYSLVLEQDISMEPIYNIEFSIVYLDIFWELNKLAIECWN